MRRTRFMSMLFLVLALGFFGVKDFRWAFGGVPAADRLVNPTNAQLRAMAERAAAGGDANAAVFATLLTADRTCPQIVEATERLVQKDPSLTWVYYSNAEQCRNDWSKPGVAEHVREWADKLEAYDPQNAVPALLAAEVIREQSSAWPKAGSGASTSPPYLQGLEAQGAWRQAMAKAYAAPRYDTYAVRRFELDRQLLWSHGWASPIVSTI